jgi:hypothetical protein
MSFTGLNRAVTPYGVLEKDFGLCHGTNLVPTDTTVVFDTTCQFSTILLPFLIGHITPLPDPGEM